MTEPTYAELEAFAVQIAEEAGRLVLPGFGSAPVATDKGTSGFATQMDIDAEKLLVSRIHERFPSHNILTEEKLTQDQGSEWTWILDPIDGTHNYMHGIPVFAVCVALRKGNDHVVGVTHMPSASETYHAAHGLGARLNGTPITCSNVAKQSDAFIALDVTKRLDEEASRRYLDLVSSVFRCRSIGSAAAAIAYVAAGRFDSYLDLQRNCHEWDWASGKVLVTEAGGRFEQFPDNTVIASNQHLFPQWASIVTGA